MNQVNFPNDKSRGEWNFYDVICNNDKSLVVTEDRRGFILLRDSRNDF